MALAEISLSGGISRRDLGHSGVDNVRLASVLHGQHPPHIAIVSDPHAYGQPKKHRDRTASVYLNDPGGNHVEILALAPEPATPRS